MFSLTNKHSELFDYLIENAKRFERASVIAHEAMADISVLPERIDESVSLQHQTEQAGLQIVIQLAKTFITPIDREDLYLLSYHLTACTDCLHGFLMRVQMYNVTKTTPAAIQGTELLMQMGKELVPIFENMKHINNSQTALIHHAERLNRLESEVDHTYRKEVSRLFTEDIPLIDVIRWKDTIAMIEETADKVEDLSNLIKGVIMKHA